jgi:hypothetical protein
MPKDNSKARLAQRLSLFANGGQLEIQGNEGYIYRGEIKDVVVEGKGAEETLVVNFTWQKKLDDGKWVDADVDPRYAVSLLSASTAAQAGERFLIRTMFAIGETLVFFPKNHHSAVEFREKYAPKPA